METELRIELKYCERCGVLWLRHAGDAQAYCGTCAPAMREIAPPAKKKPGRAQLPVFQDACGGASCA